MKNVLLVLLIIGVGITISVINERNERNEYVNNLKKDNYFGVVDTIFFDPDSKMQPKAILNTGLKVSLQNDIYKMVLKGDTLFKKNGSLEFFLVQKGDTFVYYQEYGGDQVKN